MNTIYHLSQSVGSGKTEAAINHIGRHSDQAFLYVAPTVALVREIKERLEEAAPDLSCIEAITANVMPEEENRDLVRCSTAHRVIRFLRQHVWNGSLALIITTETFRSVATQLSSDEMARLTVFLDEGIEVFTDATFQGDDLNIFTCLIQQQGHHLSAAPGAKERLYDIAYNEHRARQSRDVMKTNRCCRRLAEFIVSELYDCLGTISNNRIDAVGILRPDVFLRFNQFVVVAANFKNTLLADIWQARYGIKLEAFELPEPLWNSHYEKGSLIRIWYALHPDDVASKQCITRNAKTGARQTSPDGKRAIDQIAQDVGAFFRGREFLWVANNDFEDEEGSLASGERLPARSDGLDRFRRYHNVASLLVVNPPPHISRSLSAYTGLSVGEICFALKFAYTYQAIGRCSIRDQDNQEPIELVVLSKEEADALAELFEGATVVGQLGSLPSLSALAKEQREKASASEPRSPHRKARYKYVKNMEARGEMPLGWDEWLETVRKPTLAKREMALSTA